MPEDPDADPVKLLKHSSEMHDRSTRGSRKKDENRKLEVKMPKAPIPNASNKVNGLSVQKKAPFSIEHFAQLEGLCRIGATANEVLSFFGISQTTLNERCKQFYGVTFSHVYKQHFEKGKISLRRAQYKKAVEEGHPGMLIWLGKQHLGQQEQPTVINAPMTVFQTRIGESGEVLSEIKSHDDLKKLESWDPTEDVIEMGKEDLITSDETKQDDV